MLFFSPIINRFLRFLQTTARYSEHTLQAYSTDLKQLEKFLFDFYEVKEISRVELLHLRSWVQHLKEENLETRTINRKISAHKSFFVYCTKEKIINKNPSTSITLFKQKTKLPEFYTQKDIQHLLKLLEDHAGGKEYQSYLIFELLYCSGIRISEMIHLRVADIDLHTNKLKILGKGNKVRYTPIPKYLSTHLSAFIQQENRSFDEPLFLTPKRKPLYPNYVYRKIKEKLTHLASVNQKTAHVFRHSIATHLLDNGMNINAIQKFLGHASLHTTQIYTHNTLGKIKKNYNLAHPRA